MQLEGVEPKQLSALHGELIVFDWIEQNTGQAIMLTDGGLSAGGCSFGGIARSCVVICEPIIVGPGLAKAAYTRPSPPKFIFSNPRFARIKKGEKKEQRVKEPRI